MGCNFFARSCWTNPDNSEAKAPNPNPKRWSLLRLQQFDRAHVVEVKYHDCTNYEGHKIMVFTGRWKEREYLDPHFSEERDSPIARFKPDKEGWRLATKLAQEYGDK